MITYPELQIVIIQMQIGNLNNFVDDRIRMDPYSPYTYGGNPQLTAPNLL